MEFFRAIKKRRFLIKEKLKKKNYSQKKVIEKLLIKLEFLIKLPDYGKRRSLNFLKLKISINKNNHTSWKTRK